MLQTTDSSLDIVIAEYKEELIKLMKESIKMYELLKSKTQKETLNALRGLLEKINVNDASQQQSAVNDDNVSSKSIESNTIIEASSEINRIQSLSVLETDQANSGQVNSLKLQTFTTNFASHVRRVQQIYKFSSRSVNSSSTSQKTKCRFCRKLVTSSYMDLHIRSKHGTKSAIAISSNRKPTSPSKNCTSPSKSSIKLTAAVSSVDPDCNKSSVPSFNLSASYSSLGLLTETAVDKTVSFDRHSSTISPSIKMNASNVREKNNSGLAKSSVIPNWISLITCTICNKSVDKENFAYHMKKFHSVRSVAESSSNKKKARYNKQIGVTDIIETDDVADVLWKNKFVRCKWCRKLLRYPKYNMHIRKVHNSIGCRFKCGVCLDGFSTARGCKIHMYRSRHRSGIIKTEF